VPNAGASDPDIRTISSSLVYEDAWMVLHRDEIERRDGSRGSYAVVDKPDFAVVIPADGDRFCLVEEYRYPIGRRCWAFPRRRGEVQVRPAPRNRRLHLRSAGRPAR